MGYLHSILRERKGNKAWVVMISLPLLAFMSLFGIKKFNELFLPEWACWPTAMAFEVAIFGLAFLTPGSQNQRKRALIIAVVSAIIAVVYNIISGIIQLTVGGDLTLIPMWAKVAMAIIHGVSIPGLYLTISWFILHQGEEEGERDPLDLLAHKIVAIQRPPSLAQSTSPRQRSLPPPSRQLGLEEITYSCPHCEGVLMTRHQLTSAERLGYCRHCDPDDNRKARRERRHRRAMAVVMVRDGYGEVGQ